jgi:hypothetical protein
MQEKQAVGCRPKATNGILDFPILDFDCNRTSNPKSKIGYWVVSNQQHINDPVPKIQNRLRIWQGELSAAVAENDFGYSVVGG